MSHGSLWTTIWGGWPAMISTLASGTQTPVESTTTPHTPVSAGTVGLGMAGGMGESALQAATATRETRANNLAWPSFMSRSSPEEPAGPETLFHGSRPRN